MTPECGWPEQFRRLQRKLGWATAIFALVSVPMLVFALVGLPHVFRNPFVRHVLDVRIASLHVVLSDPSGGMTTIHQPSGASRVPCADRTCQAPLYFTR